MHFATEFWLSRLCFQRALGSIYLIAFIIAANQFIPLLGARGLQPVRLFVRHVSFRRAPSLFYINCSDQFITATIWCGVALSIFTISGFSESFGLGVSMLTWALLWIIYLSLVNVGQTFYGFGWETMLAETGFLAIFLGSSDTRPPVIVMWLIVWVLFRTMFGAGMIKVRADPCWRDLSCLFYHYETQPLPNPLSWYLHHAPRWFHKAGVLFNHFTELIVPWFYFMPRAALLLGRRNYHRVSNHADPERQSFVAQLHHDRALHSVFRRPLPLALALDPLLCARSPKCAAHTCGRLSYRNCAFAQLATGAEFVFASTTHERQFRAVAPGEHLRRIRRRDTRTARGRD